MGLEYYPHFESSNFLKDVDVVILSVPLIDFEETVASLPVDKLAGQLVVDVCPLKTHPKSVMLKAFEHNPDIDILCTNPMFGPVEKNNGESAGQSAVTNLWDARPVAYEKVRITDMQRVDRFLKIFEKARCHVVEMASEQHDATTANAEFVTHMVGRLLDKKILPATPLLSKEYAALCDVVEMTSNDSFDLFFGMYKYIEGSEERLAVMRENLASLERQLAAREAYLAAKEEMRQSDRQLLLAETKLLLAELARSGEVSIEGGEHISLKEASSIDEDIEQVEV